LLIDRKCDDIQLSINPSSSNPAEYIPPPPDVPVVEASPPSPQIVTETEPASIETLSKEVVEVSCPDSMTNEWIISILRDAFAYPLRKHGWTILIPGGLLAILLTIGAAAPVLGIFAVIFGIGYFAAYYFDIIGTTISGDESPPEWPVLSNFTEDVFRPALQLAGAFLISYFPSVLFSFMRNKNQTEGLMDSILYMLSSAYFPMACIALVMTGSLATALPHHVIPAIKRCLPKYLVPLVFLILIKVLTVLIDGIAIILPAFISAMLGAMIWFYLLMIQARITGLTCWRFRERIQWG